MSEYKYITLREEPALKDAAASWFHSKWGVPKEAYLECMDAYLQKETEYGWYLCMDGDKIVAGMGVIENDFHDRKDLAPNVCAVYTDEEYRCKGIAGNLLNMVVEDMKEKGISPIYLVTDHIFRSPIFLPFKSKKKLFSFYLHTIDTFQVLNCKGQFSTFQNYWMTKKSICFHQHSSTINNLGFHSKGQTYQHDQNN